LRVERLEWPGGKGFACVDVEKGLRVCFRAFENGREDFVSGDPRDLERKLMLFDEIHYNSVEELGVGGASVDYNLPNGKLL
jgi:hypothetical protein